MSELLAYLHNATQPQRRQAAGVLVREMRRGTTDRPNRMYAEMCGALIAGELADNDIDDRQLSRWEFSADGSAHLVRSVPRVSGFLNALARAPQAEHVIDVGCGSTALLTVGAAVLHPRAQVTGYEINGPSARCAGKIVELFGLEDRVTVKTDNILEAGAPAADLAVTETFWSGLLVEQGSFITAALANTVKEIIPASSVIYAHDGRPMPHTPWQRAAVVDLAAPNACIIGHLTSTGKGTRPVYVYSGFYDVRGKAVLDGCGTVNNLTSPVKVGTVSTESAGVVIEFTYAAGAELVDSPPSIHPLVQ